MGYKECDLGNNKPYEEVMGGFLPNLVDFYQNPKKYNIEPFCIFGNLYYVGDKKVCMHLVDTREGLILFDSGYSHNYDSLIASIRKLGFQPEDIKYVIHSHGHFDHFGGGDRLRDSYGAKILMSKVDTDLIHEMPERALMHLAPNSDDNICWPDKTINDGDIISLGNTKIRCVLAPGHTMGTMAFFFEATDGKKNYRVGYFGGIGFLSIYKEFCRIYNLPENKDELLKDTILKLQKEEVDIVIGNHPNHNCTIEKREYMIENPGTNPFINEKSWKILLESLEKRRVDFANYNYIANE